MQTRCAQLRIRRRFAEDRLRMLRAVRFATALDYTIDDATWQALVADAPAINQISAERIREELVRIFTFAEAAARLGPARWQRLDARDSARAGRDERCLTAGTVSSRRRRVFVHTLMLQMLPESFGAARLCGFISRHI